MNPVAGRSLVRLKLKMKLDGDDYVLGVAMMGAVGFNELTPSKKSKTTTTSKAKPLVGYLLFVRIAVLL